MCSPVKNLEFRGAKRAAFFLPNAIIKPAETRFSIFQNLHQHCRRNFGDSSGVRRFKIIRAHFGDNCNLYFLAESEFA